MIKVERRDDDWVCELWGASTKHPDSMFLFSNFKKTELLEEPEQIYQWLLECASKLTFPFHAKELAEYAQKYYIWDKHYYMVHIWYEDGDAENGPHCSDDVELMLAHNEEEAIRLVKDGYYMEDEFTLVQRPKDDEDYKDVFEPDGYTTERVDWKHITEWFTDLRLELPFEE